LAQVDVERSIEAGPPASFYLTITTTTDVIRGSRI
jgi:hypothetical protein